MTADATAAVADVLTEMGPVAVAVSGGVDSMTLAHVAHNTLGAAAELYHAVSPAVPREATERIRRHADAHGWSLHIVDAGETDDERYLENPVNRCFFCKTNLYGFIDAQTEHQIVSGTNLDDLGDYRPGLEAAAEHAVRHPFVEAGVDKDAVRAIARRLGLDDLAELPAAPCLSSRIETGIRVTPKRLSTVDVVERYLRTHLLGADVRCRIRSTGVVIEVDQGRLDEVRDHHDAIVDLLTSLDVSGGATFEPYRRGSAFLHGQRT